MAQLPESAENDILLKTIRAMYEGENGSDGTNSYASRRLVGENLTVSFFRRFGLSRTLNAHYGGDILLAVRDAFPIPTNIPLISLDNPRPVDSLYDSWQHREEEIEEPIRARIYPKKKRFVLLGHGGEPLDNGKAWNNKPRAPKQYMSIESERKRINWDSLAGQEAKDEIRMIRNFIHPRETVLKLLGGDESSMLMRTLSQVGKEGKVYYVSPVPSLRERVFDSVFRSLMNFRREKGEEVKSDLYTQPGEDRIFFPQDELMNLRAVFAAPFSDDLAFYESGFSDPSIIEHLREVFYSRYPLTPISHWLPTLPSELRSNSVDVVFEMDRLAHLGEDKTEELLWEIDRVLKPGGKIVFREHSREQAEIEYYGQGLLDKDYKRNPFPKGIQHAARWMTYDKVRGSNIHTVPDIPSTTNVETEETKTDYMQFLQEIYTATVQEDNTPSLNWFRRKGYLPFLIGIYGGSIDKVIETTRKSHIIP